MIQLAEFSTQGLHDLMAEKGFKKGPRKVKVEVEVGNDDDDDDVVSATTEVDKDDVDDADL